MEASRADMPVARVKGYAQGAPLTELPQFQVRSLDRAVPPEPEAGAAAGVRLTPRQLECLQWAGEGKSSVDIASILAISPATVDGHIAEACGRLGVRTRIQAIVEAYRRGWLK